MGLFDRSSRRHRQDASMVGATNNMQTLGDRPHHYEGDGFTHHQGHGHTHHQDEALGHHQGLGHTHRQDEGLGHHQALGHTHRQDEGLGHHQGLGHTDHHDEGLTHRQGEVLGHHQGLGHTHRHDEGLAHRQGGGLGHHQGLGHAHHHDEGLTHLPSKEHTHHDERQYQDESATHHHGGRAERHRRNKPHPRRPLFDRDSGHFNRRPSFGQWLKTMILDLVTMIILGAIGLGVYFADPAASRSFPIVFTDGQVVYPEFAYPLRKEIIPIWAAALLAALVPIFVFLLMQVRIRSFWDVNNAVLGLLYSLITAAVFQVFLKWLIGGLRPHFLTVCRPDPDLVAPGGDGFGLIMFNRDVCTGDPKEINDALESFPSGHSTAAFAGFIFLYYYLNAKLKVFSNHHAAMWKLAVVYMPVLGATLIAGALTIDEFHNWYDCLAGAIIGTVFATSAYRMVYASVWDFRFNHIPLTRHTPFSFGAGAPGAAGFETAVFSHAAGWGQEEAFGGAPFDAAHHLRGQVSSVADIAQGRHRGRTNHRTDDVEHQAADGTGIGHHNSTDPIHTTATSSHGRDTGSNRYKHHRKSLERKAISNPPTNTHDHTI